MTKKYYQDNKEKILAQQKEYNKANKEKIASYWKVYYEVNKEKMTADNKKYQEASKDGYYTVYYLKEEHYAGITNSLYLRLKNHKKNGKHVEDVEIVGKYKTKAEGLKVEASLHAMGYLGRNPQLKQQTLKELI
jgi:hypothetical protein